MAGRALTFRLAGINNQNFIMQDEQTGTWWQQVSGEAIVGPLAGRRLRAYPWDEVTFEVWRQEHPETLVLLADRRSKKRYATTEWEADVAELPTVTPDDPSDPLAPRDLVVGVSLGADAKAYPWSVLARLNPIADSVGGTALLIFLHHDGRSLRCFDRRVAGETLELFLEVGVDQPALVDGLTGSRWDFSGLATAGPLAGRRLSRVACLKGFWFDWKLHNPSTRLFTAGPTGLCSPS